MAASHTVALTHEQLLAALERRFDFQSARAVAGELLAAVGVAPAASYDAAAVAKLRAAVERSLTRAQAILDALIVRAAPVEPPAPEAAGSAPAVDAAPADKADKKKRA